MLQLGEPGDVMTAWGGVQELTFSGNNPGPVNMPVMRVGGASERPKRTDDRNSGLARLTVPRGRKASIIPVLAHAAAS